MKQFPSLETKEAGTDNRNIIDDGKSQKLTQDDIKALKDKGIKGEVIFKGCRVLFLFGIEEIAWILKQDLLKMKRKNTVFLLEIA